jgi:Ser/Thr protein kinase RdoA (MazF antagonist)
MTRGEVNEVYEVETLRGRVVVKVFSSRTWPEDGKLEWIEGQLTRRSIPHAPVLHYSRDDAYFPHGLMISGFIEGRSSVEALADANLSLEDYCAQVGALLRRVHQIPVKGYGYIGHGQGMYDGFVEFKLIHEVRERLRELGDLKVFEDGFGNHLEQKVRELLTPFEHRFSPVLVHEDAQPKNAIWTNERQLILIDWDEAVSSAWITDFAKLTYWAYYSNRTHELGKEKLRAAFFQGYGESGFTSEEIDRMENALHLIQAIDLLPFYREKRNEQAFAQTIERVRTLLAG